MINFEGVSSVEHSEKTKENTEWVSVWINNDEEYYHRAKALAENGNIQGLGEYLTEALQSAPSETGAWHTARELSANDYDRIDWQSIADDLADEKSERADQDADLEDED